MRGETVRMTATLGDEHLTRLTRRIERRRGARHTLAAADATGNVGPNLDTLKPSESRVAHQVEFGGAVMPAFKGKLTPAEITAVAKYVSSVAGK